MRGKVALITAATSLCLLSPFVMAAKQLNSGVYKTSVVELYTSEGCSSCPSADAFLSKLGRTKEADSIVPLAFHVDYWDYIGWEDPYAQAAFTQRQRAAAKVNKQSSIYTPEFIVDGAEARGSRGVTKQVKSTHKHQAEADIALSLSDVINNKLTIDVTVENISYAGKDIPQIYYAVYESGLSSQINAGENRGRKLTHDYVVRYLSAPQDTSNGEMHHFEILLDPAWNQRALGVSVVVNLKAGGQTLQALKSTL